MRERWLPIPGFPGYEASDQGNVRSLDRVVMRPGSPKGNQRRKGVLLKVSIQRARGGKGTPYRHVTLYGPEGKEPSQRVGSLVLAAHVGPRPPGLVMRHLNDDSLDDRLENLAWGTYSENGRDAAINGRYPDRRGGRHPGAKFTDSDVLTIRESLARGESQRAIASRYGVSYSAISDIARGKTWKHLPTKEN